MALPLMPRLNVVYFLSFFQVKPAIPTNPKPKRSTSAKVVTVPSLRATQLTPTRGNRLQRTIARKLSCFAMNLAIGGE